MVTIININDRGGVYGIEYCNAEVEKIMYSKPRRISEIVITLEIKTTKELSLHSKKNILEIARNCPVALSLNSQIIQNISITFGY